MRRYKCFLERSLPEKLARRIWRMLIFRNSERERKVLKADRHYDRILDEHETEELGEFIDKIVFYDILIWL